MAVADGPQHDQRTADPLAPSLAVACPAPGLDSLSGGLSCATVLAMQASAGNAAVTSRLSRAAGGADAIAPPCAGVGGQCADDSTLLAAIRRDSERRQLVARAAVAGGRCPCGGTIGADGQCDKCRRKAADTLAEQPLARAELFRAESRVLARNGTPHLTCFHGHAEGQGQMAQLNGVEVYAYWATWHEGEAPQAFSYRGARAWVHWRFGTVSADVESAIISTLQSARYEQLAARGENGCQYATVMSMELLNQVTRLAQRDPAARAAGDRERQAGLPPAETEPRIIGAAQGTGTTPEQTPQAQTVAPPANDSTFLGGTGPQANTAAIPARIAGLDRQPIGGTGSYTMRLDYSVAGADLLSQVVEAMNWVNYHWERYDITGLARQGMAEQAVQARRHTAASSSAEVGRMDASGRAAERAADDLATDTETAAHDLAHPIEASTTGTAGDVMTRAMANYESLVLLPASAIVSLGGVALGALADLMGGTQQEREIPWPRTAGVMMIRCIAQPSPQGAHGEQRRAPSVAVKIVEIQDARRMSSAALDEPEAAIAEARLRVVLERDPARRAQAEADLGEQETIATGTPLEVIDAAIARKTRERAGASPSRQRAIDGELARLREQRELATERTADASGVTVRPRAALVSQVTGETYPLLLQLIERPTSGSRHAWSVSDVTSADGRRYEGAGASAEQAVWEAFRDMAGRNDYGNGSLSVRLPAGAPFDTFTNRERQFDNHPRDVAIVQARINDLVTVLVTLGLFVPGVGEVAAVIGAAVAAGRLIDRWNQGTLRLDAAAIGDLIGVLGAVAQGAAAVGRMRVISAGNRFVLAAEAGDATAVRAAAEALGRASETAERLAAVERLAGAGGTIWGSLSTLDQLLAVNQQELSGTISHAVARRRRAELLTAAVRDNALLVLGEGRRGQRESGPGSGAAGDHGTPHPGGEHGTPPASGEPGTPRHSGEPEGGAGQAGEGPTVAPHGSPGTGLTGRERIRARAATPDGLHHIIVLEDGRIIRCSPTCDMVRAHYDEFLHEPTDNEERRSAAEDYTRRLDELQRQSTEGDDAQKQAAAEEIARLDVELRRFAAEHLADEFGVRSGRLMNLLEVFNPQRLRELRQQLGRIHRQLFEYLGARATETIRRFALALEQTAGDSLGTDHVIRMLEAARNRVVTEVQLQQALTGLTQLANDFPGRVSGELYRDVRAALERGDLARVNALLGAARNTLSGASAPVEAARRITAEAANGQIHLGSDYHGRLGRARELEILSSPDAVYHSSGGGERLIFRKGGDIVIAEGAGSSAGNLITSYGPGGPRGESGAAIYGGSPGDPGLPITHAMITGGQIPRPGGGFEPSAQQVIP